MGMIHCAEPPNSHPVCFPHNMGVGGTKTELDQQTSTVRQAKRASFKLLPEDVHVWHVPLNQPLMEPAFFTTLSTDEQARATKFHVKDDRCRWVVCRGVLRALIGQHMDMEPSTVQFSYGACGKPALAATDNFRFNVSHSQDVAVIAISWQREIGIDIEVVRHLDDAMQVAQRVFADEEVAAYTAVPNNLKLQAFFNCWTRKEAFIKAIGEGMSFPLKEFAVTLYPNESARLLHICGDHAAASMWQLRSLAPAPGFVGAVAAKGHEWRLSCWQWPYSTSSLFPSCAWGSGRHTI